MFALDANVFIEAHRRYYGLDLCPGFWECLRHYGARQRLLSIDRVRSELLRGRDALSKWVKDSPATLFVSSAEPAVADAFADMMPGFRGTLSFGGKPRPSLPRQPTAGWLRTRRCTALSWLRTKHTVRTSSGACRWATSVTNSTCLRGTHSGCCGSSRSGSNGRVLNRLGPIPRRGDETPPADSGRIMPW